MKDIALEWEEEHGSRGHLGKARRWMRIDFHRRIWKTGCFRHRGKTTEAQKGHNAMRVGEGVVLCLGGYTVEKRTGR